MSTVDLQMKPKNTSARRGDHRALLDEQSWRFDGIAELEPDRARKLQEAGPPELLQVQIQSALRDGFSDGSVRLGWEPAHGEPEHRRGVVQFPVTPALFDWFFNARTGYRAHFRVHSECGLKFNTNLIERICQVLRKQLPTFMDVRLLDTEFEDQGLRNI